MMLIENPRANIYKWVPFELHFGIPLFSVQLNRLVCERIEQYRLFSEKNLVSYSKSSRNLSLRLLDFIAQCTGRPLNIELGITPHPTRIVKFSDKKISFV